MKRLLLFGFLFSLMAVVLFSCQKELSLEVDRNTAHGSLHDDSTGECFPIIVNGTYYNGVSANRDTNFIQLVVNVKSTGNYTITSSLSNGFSFADSGFFSKLGFDTILLHAKGAPILPQATDFTVSFDTTVCGFTVDVKDSTGTGLGGGTGGDTDIDTSYVDDNPAAENEWHFTDSITGQTYAGTFPVKATIDESGDVPYLTLAGLSADGTNVFGTGIELPNSVVMKGVYPISGDNFLGMSDETTQTVPYYSDEDVAEDGLSFSYIRITDYDEVTKHVQGSFHCWTVDDNGENPTLIKGSFNTFIE